MTSEEFTVPYPPPEGIYIVFIESENLKADLLKKVGIEKYYTQSLHVWDWVYCFPIPTCKGLGILFSNPYIFM